MTMKEKWKNWNRKLQFFMIRKLYAFALRSGDVDFVNDLLVLATDYMDFWETYDFVAKI